MRVVMLPLILAAAAPTTALSHPCEAKVAELRDYIYGTIRPELDRRRARDRMALTVPSLAETAREQLRKSDQDEAMYLGLLEQERAACMELVREERAATEKAAKRKARAAPGCTKDTECKGDRICVSGACVDLTPKK